MLELEEAVDRILAAVPSARREETPLAEAEGRVLADEPRATVDLPPFENSAMDGYAVRTCDLTSARPDAPVSLRLSGRVAAGQDASTQVAPGCCVRLFTGSPMPPGADAVVRQEDTRPVPGDPGSIQVLATPSAGLNIRSRGEDVRSGTVLLRRGTVIRASHMSLLSACGFARVGVGRQPRIGVLASGSELREPGAPLAPGEIHESNRLALAALIHRAGGIARRMPLVADSLSGTTDALAEAFGDCDMVVTCGGVSVGDLDFIKPAFEGLGGTVEFWRVAMKPGRPFLFGRWRGKCLFGLPGNPVSAFVTFLLLVRPALLRWQGVLETGLPTHPAILAEEMTNPGDCRHFMRVSVDSAGLVRSAGPQGSHRLTSLAAANALLDLPPRSAFAPGTIVRVLKWEM